jgi:hypothetical protein
MKETCRIVVVANGGLEKRRSDVDYVEYGDDPFIYARAINLGVEVTPGTEDIVICGDDTRLFTPNGYSKLFRNGDAITSAAITGCCGNRNQIWRRTKDLREELTMLCFIAVGIPADVFNAVGGMDERYSIDYGCEDGDYCFRARKLGVRLLVDESVVVEHGVLPSEYRQFGALSFEKNAKLFEEIHGVPYGT